MALDDSTGGSGYEAAPATRMLAAACIFCNRPLVDAESVERGCGPICQQKYQVYNASTPPDWPSFGSLVEASPEYLRERMRQPDILRLSEAGDNHAILNRLIHLAGTKWETGASDAQLVMIAVADLARALGYVSVHDKLVLRYLVGEPQDTHAPHLHGIVVVAYERRGPQWKFHLPRRIGDEFRDFARRIEAAGGWLDRTDRYSVNFPATERTWIQILNALIPTFTGTVGLLPSGEKFVVPDAPLPVPAEPGASAGAPTHQTGESGINAPPPLDAAQVPVGTRIELRDGRTMYVRWLGEKNGSWRIGFAPTMRDREWQWCGIGDVVTVVAAKKTQSEVESRIGGALPPPVADRQLPQDMFEYQKEGALWLDARGVGLLCLEQGMGKTLTSLAVTDAPALVICPAHLKVNWVREVTRWRPDLTVAAIGTGRIPTDKAKREALIVEQLKCNVVVVNYEHLIKAEKLAPFLAIQWRTLIVDEAHRLKSLRVYAKKQDDGTWQSEPSQTPKSGAAIWHLRQQCARVFLLTGTPMLKQHAELFSLLHLVAGHTPPLRTFNEYARKFCPPREMHVGGGRVVKLYDSNVAAEELHDLVYQHMFRKTKEILDLPEKSRQCIYVSLDADVAKEYRKAADDFIAWVRKQGGSAAAMRAQRAEVISRLTALRRLSAIGKAPAVGEAIIQHVVGTGRPLVVFAHHADAGHALAGFLDAFNQAGGKLGDGPELGRPLRYVVYGWGHKGQQYIDAFQDGTPADAPADQREYTDVFIGSIQACTTGLNLFRASDTYFLERDWTPLNLVQAEDRIHRIGQKNACTITYFEGAGTIDAHIAKLLVEKTRTVARVIDGVDLSEEDAQTTVMGSLFGETTEYESNPPSEPAAPPDWAEPE